MSEDISKIISKYKMYMSFDGNEYQMIQKVDLNKTFEEIERLNNIIKEVREYIEDDRLYMSNGNVLSIANTGCGKKILEILNKENI